MPGRKNKHKEKIYKEIKCSNGTRIKALERRFDCHKNTILYNIKKLKKENKIVGPYKKKYYHKDHPKASNLSGYSLFDGFEYLNSDFPLTTRYVRSLYYSQYNEEIRDISDDKLYEFIYTNKEKIRDVKLFENNLINSLKVFVKPSSFSFPDKFRKHLKEKILDLIYEFTILPSFWENLESLDDLNLNLNIQIGDNSPQKMQNLTFKELRDLFSKRDLREEGEFSFDKLAISEKLNRDKFKKIIRKYLFEIEKFVEEKDLRNKKTIKMMYKRKLLNNINSYSTILKETSAPNDLFKTIKKEAIEKTFMRFTNILKREIELRAKADDFKEEKRIEARSKQYTASYSNYCIKKIILKEFKKDFDKKIKNENKKKKQTVIKFLNESLKKDLKKE